MPPPRPLPRVNRADFYRLDGDELLHLLATAIRAHAEEHPSAELDHDALAVVAWAKLCVDVPNGGFTQFFYNHRGDAGVLAAARRLEQLGVPKAAALVREAHDVYLRHRPAFAVDNPWDGGLFGSVPAFDELDRAFGRVAGRASRAMAAWARVNISRLAVGENQVPIDPHYSGAVEVAQPNGLVGQYLEVERGKPSGAYREFFDDGAVSRVTFYRAGKVSGDFWPDGQLRKKESKRGAHRVIEWYYPGGKLQKRFVRGKDGHAAEPVRLYHQNGQLAEELHVAGPDPLGPWLKFFEDGSPRLQARHGPGRSLVVDNAWDDDHRQIVKDGRGTFHDDGRSINWAYDVFFRTGWAATAELEGGIRHGKCTCYHQGVLWSVAHYRRGQPHGEWTTYWDNGRVRGVIQYADGRAGRAEKFPKFDDPVPAVRLRVEADEALYAAWRHRPVDEYPRPKNLEAVRQQLRVPPFLREVHERNLAGQLKSEYEDVNTFDDGIAYFLTVDEAGAVTDVWANGSGVYSAGDWGTYVELLKGLEFTPGRVKGRAVRCSVLALVDHTFIEGTGKRQE